MRNLRTRVLSAAAAPIFFLAACSGGDSAEDAETATSGSEDGSETADDAAATSGPPPDLSAITVTSETNSDGIEIPALLWDGKPFTEGELPFDVATTGMQQVEEGAGAEVQDGQEVTVSYLAVNGTSGEELLSTFPTEETVVMDLSNDQLLPAFLESLPGQLKDGSFILAMPPGEGFGAAGNPGLGIGAEDTVVFYIEVEGSSDPLTQAEGTAVTPEDGLPTVDTDGTSAAEITIGDADEPSELVVQPLIEGAGSAVEANQTIKVNYTGVKFSDGEQFDSSFNSGEPFSTVIGAGAVIPGWDEGLIGQTVGSRVLLVIPPDQAYGEDGENELAGESLVFVIDILSAN